MLNFFYKWILIYDELFLMLKVRSELSKNDRKKFNTILIIEVHARDIIDTFVRDRYVEFNFFFLRFLYKLQTRRIV